MKMCIVCIKLLLAFPYTITLFYAFWMKHIQFIPPDHAKNMLLEENPQPWLCKKAAIRAPAVYLHAQGAKWRCAWSPACTCGQCPGHVCGPPGLCGTVPQVFQGFLTWSLHSRGGKFNQKISTCMQCKLQLNPCKEWWKCSCPKVEMDMLWGWKKPLQLGELWHQRLLDALS